MNNISKEEITTKTRKKRVWIVPLVLLILIATFVLVVRHELKEYTRNNTWVDLKVELHTDVKGSVATKKDEEFELTGLMAGDVVPIAAGCDFVIKEVHPKGAVVIDVKDAYTQDNPMQNSVKYPKEISLYNGESKQLYVTRETKSYSIRLEVTANYYR